MKRTVLPLTAAACFTATLALSPQAAAFCGFYVTGADASLYANASMVVLMRDGTQTVISMQNNYEGPPEDFALIVPVPELVTQDQVKTLSKEVFGRVDTLGAPRLVEYWEVDPCSPGFEFDTPTAGAGGASQGTDDNGVTILAEFPVAEYDVVILSAEQSDGLETFLIESGYNIPEGAAAALEPYVQAQTKFFVANVDPERVTFQNGQAILSPLRIAYNSPEFSLPIRLGLLNSKGTQDLIVNILASERYQVQNYENLLVPTNIRVRNQVRNEFGGFYEALFEEATRDAPNTVVTEYSWSAQSCDPCPTEPLSPSELAELGGDVVFGLGQDQLDPFGGFVDVTLTRLHYRYTGDSADADLIFETASPIIGGRGQPDQAGVLEATTEQASFNNFQGRYIILHPWTEELTCAANQVQRGFWGGPDGTSGQPMTQGSMNMALSGAAPEASNLRALLAEPIEELDVSPALDVDPLVDETTLPAGPMASRCTLSAAGGPSGSVWALAGLGLVLGWARRSRRSLRQ